MVLLLSTHSGTETITVMRNSKQGKVVTEIPSSVQDFNLNMRGVDIFNKMKTLYYYNHHFWKWWKSIFIFLFEVSLINSYILFKETTKSKIEQKEFRMKIAKKLINYSYHPINENLIDGKAKNNNCELILTKTQRDCSVCSNRKIKRVTTQYKCRICDIYVCPSKCYDVHQFSI